MNCGSPEIDAGAPPICDGSSAVNSQPLPDNKIPSLLIVRCITARRRSEAIKLKWRILRHITTHILIRLTRIFDTADSAPAWRWPAPRTPPWSASCSSTSCRPSASCWSRRRRASGTPGGAASARSTWRGSGRICATTGSSRLAQVEGEGGGEGTTYFKSINVSDPRRGMRREAQTRTNLCTLREDGDWACVWEKERKRVKMIFILEITYWHSDSMRVCVWHSFHAIS